MPTRRTKRGTERTPLRRRYDVVVCGASFAGLAVARELAGAGQRRAVLVLDRYEVGERQTSACAAPDRWLTVLGAERSIRQTFDSLVIHTPHTTVRFRLPWKFSTFDYPALCADLDAQNDARFDVATVTGRVSALGGDVVTVQTDRGEVTAPLVVDALGWRRVLGAERLPAAGRAAVARARGAPVRIERRDRDVDRPRGGPRRLRLELPGG